METTVDPSREKVLMILKERAKALARIPEPVRAVQGGMDVLAFTLGKERFALASVFVREVRAIGSITPVPCTPAFVLGIVNLGGQFNSVLDFRKLFGIPPLENAHPDEAVIFIGNSEMELGIAADSILGIRSISPEELQPPPTAVPGLQGGFLRGIGKDGLIVLDGDRILMNRAILVHEETA